jgi:DNA-binding transcriptional LysR family regulator
MTAKALAKSIAREDLAPLSIGVSDSVNVEIIMGPIAEMFRGFPGLQLKLQHGGGGAIIEMLKQGSAEIAIAGPIDDAWERLDHWALFDEKFELAIRDDHPLALDNEMTLEKLQKLPLFCQTGCEMHDTAAAMIAAKGLSTFNMHDVVTYHDLMALVSAGVGAAIVPHSAPRIEHMKRTPITDFPLVRAVSAYAVAGRRREAAASAFLNLLRSTEFLAAA